MSLRINALIEASGCLARSCYEQVEETECTSDKCNCVDEKICCLARFAEMAKLTDELCKLGDKWLEMFHSGSPNSIYAMNNIEMEAHKLFAAVHGDNIEDNEHGGP